MPITRHMYTYTHRQSITGRRVSPKHMGQWGVSGHPRGLALPTSIHPISPDDNPVPYWPKVYLLGPGRDLRNGPELITPL